MHKKKKLIKETRMRRNKVRFERYYVDGEAKFLICAQGPHYYVWKRVNADYYIAKEAFYRYRFFVWFIDLFNDFYPVTRVICLLMNKFI